jgi:hypothetical protein
VVVALHFLSFERLDEKGDEAQLRQASRLTLVMEFLFFRVAA